MHWWLYSKCVSCNLPLNYPAKVSIGGNPPLLHCNVNNLRKKNSNFRSKIYGPMESKFPHAMLMDKGLHGVAHTICRYAFIRTSFMAVVVLISLTLFEGFTKGITCYNTLPIPTSAGDQWTESTNIGYNQWLSLAKITLKVLPASRNHSLVTYTSHVWGVYKGMNS